MGRLTASTTPPAHESALGDSDIAAPSSQRSTPCDLERLRRTLPQLARGLQALHNAGKIHRDIKPSNIQVTSDGRVVLLDFGLVTEHAHWGGADGMIVGAVAYMAPEQCAGDVRLSAAADWYGVGVVLFQALTGRLPFEGALTRVLFEKQTEAAPRPSHFVQGVPHELDDLCAGLLEREPSDRPSAAEVLRRLGVGDLDWMSGPTASISHPSEFTGRDAELAMLDAALAPLAVQRASVVLVRGPSGVGKSSLVAQFLERVRVSRGNVLLLRGRCLDHEAVPYQAIDSLMDELSHWWQQQRPQDVHVVLPRDAYLLRTLFPVLGSVPAIADAPRTRLVADPHMLRTCAFDALRETLQQLGRRYTVVLFLDDTQWADHDSAALLVDLMRAPDPPPVLLVLAARVEGSEPVLDLVRRMDAAQHLIELGRLSQ